MSMRSIHDQTAYEAEKYAEHLRWAELIRAHPIDPVRAEVRSAVYEAVLSGGRRAAR